MFAIAGVPLVTLGLAAGPSAAPSGDRQVLSGPSVAIYDLAGRVTVESGTGTDVVVEVTRGGADAAQLEIERGMVGNWQTMRVVFPGNRVVYRDRDRNSWSDWGGWGTQIHVGDDGRFSDESLVGGHGRRREVRISGRGNGLEAHADLRVRVPRGKTLALFLAVGECSVTNVDGDLRVDVASASVTTRGTRGSLFIDAGSGELRVSEATGDVSLDTGSGGSTVRGLRGAKLSLDTGSGGVTLSDIEVDQLRADTGSGSVEIEDLKASDIGLDTGSGSVRLSLLPGPLESLMIDSGSGGVILAVPPGIDADFDVDTGSGGIDINVPHKVIESERDHVRGTFGDGRGRIRIETGSGGVRINPRAASGTRQRGGVGKLIGLTFV
jgi:hypothetical protein